MSLLVSIRSKKKKKEKPGPNLVRRRVVAESNVPVDAKDLAVSRAMCCWGVRQTTSLSGSSGIVSSSSMILCVNVSTKVSQSFLAAR